MKLNPGKPLFWFGLAVGLLGLGLWVVWGFLEFGLLLLAGGGVCLWLDFSAPASGSENEKDRPIRCSKLRRLLLVGALAYLVLWLLTILVGVPHARLRYLNEVNYQGQNLVYHAAWVPYPFRVELTSHYSPYALPPIGEGRYWWWLGSVELIELRRIPDGWRGW